MSVRVPREPEGAERAPAPAGAPPLARHDVLTLQRRAGNRAVGRMLARREAESTGAPAVDWSTQPKAEATATETRRRIRTDLLAHMRASGSLIVRNTVELFAGNPPLLTLEATTKRSDSDAKVAAGGAGVDALNDDAYFRGVTMDNVHFQSKGMIGTLDGTTMYLRGHDSGKTLRTLDQLAATVVHEVSHFLVSQYGELPGTDESASSFDRYADEFRAYWVSDGGVGHGLTGAARATAIREHLVGTAGDATSGYADLHKRYFKDGEDDFKAKVDALAGPTGFNVANSLRLHRLWQLLTRKRRDDETIGDIVLMVSALTVDERREAKASPLLAKLIRRLGDDGAKRVRTALEKMVGPKYERFLAAIVGGKADEIKAAYADLPRDDRAAIAMNAGFLLNVGRLVTDAGARARLYAMTTTGDAAQYDAMARFLDAARAAKDLDGALPAELDAALKGLNERARWALFAWEREGAMKDYVGKLGSGLADSVRERLRE